MYQYRIAEENEDVDIDKLNEAFAIVKESNDQINSLKEENQRLRGLLQEKEWNLSVQQQQHKQQNVVVASNVIDHDHSINNAPHSNDAKSQDSRLTDYDTEKDIKEVLLTSFLRVEKKNKRLQEINENTDAFLRYFQIKNFD